MTVPREAAGASEAEGDDMDVMQALQEEVRQGAAQFARTAVGARFIARVRALATRPSETRCRRDARLARLLRRATTRCRRYAGVPFDCTGGPLEALRHFPPLSKKELRERPLDLFATPAAAAEIQLTRTGGSTGERTSHVQDVRTEGAIYYALLGRLLRDREIETRGLEILDLAPRALALDRRTRTEPLCIANFCPELHVRWLATGVSGDHDGVVELALLSVRPNIRLVLGAPSRLVEYARFCGSSGLRPRPEAVVSTHEQLLPAARVEIEAALGAPVVEIYGTGEVGVCGWQCDAGSIHVEEDFAIVEILDRKGDVRVEDGTIGRVVVTSLKSWLAPVIRYDTGDLAALLASPCACGRRGPALRKIEGRAAVVLARRDGRAAEPYPLLAAVDAAGLTDFQLVQPRPGELRLVIAPPQRDVTRETRLAAELERIRWFVSGFDLAVDWTGRFVLSESGKRNTCVVESR